MKNIASLLLLSILVLSSCSDDDVDLDTIGSTFEIENIDFDQDNNFSIGFTFPVPLFDSDGILVYRLENVNNGIDVWEPLPTSNIFLDNGGELFYRFNYTRNDVDILVESPDFSVLTNEFTQNQVFRIIIVPSAFAEDTSIDISNMDDVISKLHINENKIKVFHLK